MSHLRTSPGLLARFRAGEPAALTEVYRAYVPRLHQLLRRGFVVKSSGMRVPGLVSPHDQADATQQAFVRAFKPEARLAYDGERDYWPYLASIARNELVSHHRRHGRELLDRGRDSWPETDVAEAEPDADPEHGWLEPKSLAIAREYVASLPELLRAVHNARYMEELSQRDAAERLRLSLPKLRKLEDRLRRELLDRLEQAGIRDSSAAPVPGSVSHG